MSAQPRSTAVWPTSRRSPTSTCSSTSPDSCTRRALQKRSRLILSHRSEQHSSDCNRKRTRRLRTRPCVRVSPDSFSRCTLTVWLSCSLAALALLRSRYDVVLDPPPPSSALRSSSAGNTRHGALHAGRSAELARKRRAPLDDAAPDLRRCAGRLRHWRRRGRTRFGRAAGAGRAPPRRRRRLLCRRVAQLDRAKEPRAHSANAAAARAT